MLGCRQIANVPGVLAWGHCCIAVRRYVDGMLEDEFRMNKPEKEGRATTYMGM